MDPIQALQNLITSLLSSFDSLLKSVPYEYILLFVGIFPIFVLALALYFFEKKKSLEKDVSILRKKFETYASNFMRKCEEVLIEKRNKIEDLIHKEVIPESIRIFIKTELFKSLAPTFDETKIDKESIKTELEKNVEYVEFTKKLSEFLDNIEKETIEDIKKF
ncbi:MAG: hypothetical protein QXQ69_01205 [Candidatus Aenigmatarchaeota archaeon]